MIAVALDQLSQVRTHRPPRGTVLPDPIVPTSLAKTSTGARSIDRPEGTWIHALPWGLAAGDLLLVAAVVAAMLWWSGTSHAIDVTAAASAATAMLFTLLIGGFRGYDPRRSFSDHREYTSTLRAGVVWAALLICGLYFAQITVPPSYVLGAIGGSLALAMLTRTGQRALVRRRREHGQWKHRTLLVGDPAHLRYLATQLRAHPGHGFDVVGVCTAAEAESWDCTPVLGDVTRAAEIVADHEIRVVVVVASCMDALELRRFCWLVERHGVELLIAPNIEEVSAGRLELRPLPGTSLVNVAIGPSRLHRMAKAVMDRLLGGFLLLAVSPIIGAAALLVRVTSSGSSFYRQVRIGKEASRFTMYKLRTMYKDADRRREALLAHSDGNAVMFKMRDDPRTTPVGRVLRRFSIDELPQLWNVVRGDMSLVGPRPPLEREVAAYDDDARQRLRVKPGLTGLWQVSGRSDLDWEQSIRLDLDYVDNRSLSMDVSILGRTFRAVLGGRGAY